MKPFTAAFVAAVTLIGAVSPALAQAAPQPKRTAEAKQVVMLCEADAATRRAFTREYGMVPTFVTAEQALRARARGETWNAPRCMTAREHARLSQTLTAYAAVR